ncbi:hypothetical protein VTH06DRAFT_7237 [Thermothelomyces fergusii]
MGSQVASSAFEHAPQCASATPLTAVQLHALLDILTHHQTYAEVESFKDPNTISEYGYPFTCRHQQSGSTPTYAPDSETPLLAGVLRTIVLPLPGVRNLPPEFWHVRFQSIMEKLAEAGLSESYDKGVLGMRKILATAASALHEAVSRGILGGISDDANRNFYGEYDRSKATDLVRAWEDGVRELVYGDLTTELFICAAEKQSLEEHSAGVRAVVDYIIIHLATLMHRMFVVSPEGPYLLKLLENTHRLLPYSLIKQTLRIGNAATMLHGMMRLLLAKVGVGALSNWVGLTQNAGNGMNLLQRSAEAVEKAKGCSKEQLAAIREYLNKSSAERDDIRRASAQQRRSMVEIILERSNPELLASLTETRHSECSEYLSALLEARDRDEITNVLCRQSPDFFTQAIKDVVAAFEPMVRAIHQKVDLREHVSAGEAFLTEFINISRTKNFSGFFGSLTPAKSETSQTTRIPSVEDYVLLLRNNRHLLYNWLHQLASQCPEVCDEFRAWAEQTIKVFRQHADTKHAVETTDSNNAEDGNRPGAAGALSGHLQHLFASLPASTRSRILPAIDAHAAYLSALDDLSLRRMQRILDNMASINTTAASAPAATAPSVNAGTAPAAPTSYYLSIPSYLSGAGRSTPRAPSPPSASQASPLINGTDVAGGGGKKRSFSGPGIYLARWQQLLDDTVIGPASSMHSGGDNGLRSGRDVKGVLARGKTGSGGDGAKVGSDLVGVSWESRLLAKLGKEEVEMEEEPRAVDVRCVVDALGQEFKELARGLIKRQSVNGA